MCYEKILLSAMATTIGVDPAVRDRLRAYGTAGMTYSEIVQNLMDQVDREAFVAEIRRRIDDVKNWIDLDETR